VKLELVIAPDPCTVEDEIPVAAASRRTLQCVVPSGGGSSVLANTRLTPSSVIWRGRPDRGAVSNPSIRRSEKFRRHSPTVGSDTPTSRAISVLLAPVAARNTIRARIACSRGADGVLSTTVLEVPYTYKRLMERCTRGKALRRPLGLSASTGTVLT
jgi:hypothetical protein